MSDSCAELFKERHQGIDNPAPFPNSNCLPLCDVLYLTVIYLVLGHNCTEGPLHVMTFRRLACRTFLIQRGQIFTAYMC